MSPEGVEGGEEWGGVPSHPNELGDLGKRYELTQWGPGKTSAANAVFFQFHSRKTRLMTTISILF